MCISCQVNRVAWSRPRVDFCYECLPGGPVAPPPCSRCGSDRYFNNGLCDACHPRGPLHLGSCLGCLAWGVYREYRFQCWNCRWWKTHYVEGDCNFCGRHTFLSELRACRLCWEQARKLQQPGRAVDLADTTRCGQQLFFANLGGTRKRPHHYLEPDPPAHRHGTSRHRKPRLSRLSRVTGGHDYRPVAWSQLSLFEMELDPAIIRARAVTADSDLLRFCDQVARDHGAAHGWTRKQTNDVRRSLRLLQVLQDTPGSKIYATDVLKVPSLQLGNVSALSTLDILAAAGLLIDDRTSTVERFFSKQIAGLPPAMTVQLRIWFDTMLNGSTTAPRRLPRHPETAKLHTRAIAPIVRVWASQGHDSLAAIERDDILARLPAAGPRRHSAEQGLRSLFGVLKARKAIFVNPTRGIPFTNTNNTIPLPLDIDAIRAALNSPDPAAALAVALVAFHALTSRQIRALEVTDISDARLTLDGRSIPLARPVLPRLSAWLDHRNRTWPTTPNPHLFINRRTGPRLTEVSRPFPWKQVNLRPQTLREDRILDEVRATGGDVRRICELFGLSVDAALRYTATLDQPVGGD